LAGCAGAEVRRRARLVNHDEGNESLANHASRSPPAVGKRGNHYPGHPGRPAVRIWDGLAGKNWKNVA